MKPLASQHFFHESRPLLTSNLSNPTPATAPAASAFTDPQNFNLAAYCYADRLDTIPAIASAFALAGGWVTDRRTVSSTEMDFRVELQLNNILDLYAAIVETGLELTRNTHALLTELCTCRFHPRVLDRTLADDLPQAHRHLPRRRHPALHPDDRRQPRLTECQPRFSFCLSCRSAANASALRSGKVPHEITSLAQNTETFSSVRVCNNGGKTMKALLTLALAAFATTAAAHAQVGVYIGRTPPPLRYETRPPVPGPGDSWIDGYYEPWQGGYRWHGGYWGRPPYAGAYWVHPHYDHYDRGWAYHEGYWGHDDRHAYEHHWDHR